jgi:hypothetical protein
MTNLSESWNVNVNSDNFYNHKYNNPAHEQSRLHINNHMNQYSQRRNKIVLVNEKQLFEGIIAGFCVAMSSVILFKSGLSTKAFKRVTYDWLEVKVILGIMLGWMIVWCFRKTSNVFYDRYVGVYGRNNPYEIAINVYP